MIQLDSIKLAFFDIDGTVVNAAGEISKPVRESIHKLKDKNVILSLATGRPIFASRWVIEELQISGPSLLGAGSIIYDPVENKVLHEWELGCDRAKELLYDALEQELHVELYTAFNYYTVALNSYTDIHTFYLKQNPEAADLNEVLTTQKVNRLLLMGLTETEKEKINNLIEKYSDFSWGIGKGATHPDIVFANATHPQATRNWGFDYIVDRLKISPLHVMSFGDAESDKQFISRAGLGVAMGNAPSSVKEVAKAVCGSVEDDGIALFLEQHF